MHREYYFPNADADAAQFQWNHAGKFSSYLTGVAEIFQTTVSSTLEKA